MLQRFINSSAGLSFAYGLARSMPPRLGYWIAHTLGNLVASLGHLPNVRSVKANQWVVRGGGLSRADLTAAARAVYRYSGQSLYDFFHNFRDFSAVSSMVEFSPSFMECIQRSREGKFGQLLLTPHCSNFDLVGRAAVINGMRMQVLSYPEVRSDYHMQNQLRALPGMDVTPISFSALKQATQRMRSGGTALTGIDRPTDTPTVRPRFFDRPASLPTGYVRLALAARVPVVIVMGETIDKGHYFVNASEPIPLKSDPDGEKESLYNAEMILERIEPCIRSRPQQWAMFYTVWPESLSELP